ncbi:MAG: DUF2269 family protein [Gaiellaceae bacterium]
MGTIYDWLLFAHVLAAMVWVGGLVMIMAVGTRTRRSGDPDAVARFVRGLRILGPAVLAPAAVLLLVFGIWMVVDSAAWDFGQTWVRVGATLLILSVLIGAVYLSRAGIAAERAVAAGDHREAARQLGRWAWGIGATLVLLVAATWDMVVKPGL